MRAAITGTFDQGDDIGALAVRRENAQRAAFLDQVERRLDIFLAARPGDEYLELEMAAFRIEDGN